MTTKAARAVRTNGHSPASVPADYFVLESLPVALPFAGAYAEIAAVYNVDAVMSLGATYDTLMGDLEAEENTLLAERADLPADAEAQRIELNQALEAIADAGTLRLIPHIIVRFTGPPNLPIPAQPATLRRFSPLVRQWLITQGLTEVKEQFGETFRGPDRDGVVSG